VIGYDPLRGLHNLLMLFDVLEVGMQDEGSLEVLHEFFLLSGELI
jgi:hypothetical protein